MGEGLCAGSKTGLKNWLFKKTRSLLVAISYTAFSNQSHWNPSLNTPLNWGKPLQTGHIPCIDLRHLTNKSTSLYIPICDQIRATHITPIHTAHTLHTWCRQWWSYRGGGCHRAGPPVLQRPDPPSPGGGSGTAWPSWGTPSDGDWCAPSCPQGGGYCKVVMIRSSLCHYQLPSSSQTIAVYAMQGQLTWVLPSL